MKTIHTEKVGDLRLVLRSDGGIYLGRPDQYGIIDRDMIRIGGSAAICGALAESLTSMAIVVRGHALGLSSAAASKRDSRPPPPTQAELTATLASNYEPGPDPEIE